jgi:glycosyltransferase involved in cell wall biosynthesis
LKVVGVVARKCARVIAISDSVAEKLKAIGLPGTSVTRVYNATSASRDKTGGVAKSVPDLDEKAGNFIILLPSASIREDKGLLVAVDTVGNLPERVVLWITGAIDDLAAQPFLSGLHRRIDELGIADRVKFIGRREDIFEMMQRADLILVPSLCEEGFGLVAAEAMLLERPVMVSNRGGLPEVVGHESGLTFDPENVPVLVEKIRKVMDDPAMLDAISLAGRRRAEELFVYSQWSGKIAASMMQVCGRNINAENS